jgi:carboxymethylenebutenolidase
MSPLKRFPVGDEQARGYLALPEGGSGPGVLVLHAWWGLNPFIRRLCDRLAFEGFTAFAPDVYQGNVARSIDEAKYLRDQVQRERVLATLTGALAYLRGQAALTSPRVALLGLSMGASYALRLSVTRPHDIAAVVAFYGTSGGKFDHAEAAYQGHFAEQDPFASAASIVGLESRLRAARRPVEFFTYPGTGRWFFEDDRPGAYHAAATQKAWSRTLRFLHKHLNRRPRSARKS